jgi:choline dehydrogenase
MFWVSDPAEPDSAPQLDIEVVLLKPRSRGTVRLQSAGPMDPPRIELPDFRDPADLERLAEGYRRASDLTNQSSVRRLCPAAPSREIADGAQLLQEVRASAYSIPHVVGTCAMGPSPDNGAVVNDLGQVHGTERLFVVDASIVPTAPSGFPHIVTIMVAERLSEHIAALL